MNNKKLFRGVGGIYRYHKLINSYNSSWNLIWKPICASTEIELSNWITEEPVGKDQLRAIFASSQKFGQGQRGRYWHSPKGGVWVSAAINIEGFNTNNSENMNKKKLFRGVAGIYRYHQFDKSSRIPWRLLWKPICASTEIELSNWITEKPVKKNQLKAIF